MSADYDFQQLLRGLISPAEFIRRLERLVDARYAQEREARRER